MSRLKVLLLSLIAIVTLASAVPATAGAQVVVVRPRHRRVVHPHRHVYYRHGHRYYR